MRKVNSRRFTVMISNTVAREKVCNRVIVCGEYTEQSTDTILSMEYSTRCNISHMNAIVSYICLVKGV